MRQKNLNHNHIHLVGLRHYLHSSPNSKQWGRERGVISVTPNNWKRMCILPCSPIKRHEKQAQSYTNYPPPLLMSKMYPNHYYIDWLAMVRFNWGTCSISFSKFSPLGMDKIISPMSTISCGIPHPTRKCAGKGLAAKMLRWRERSVKHSLACTMHEGRTSGKLIPALSVKWLQFQWNKSYLLGYNRKVGGNEPNSTMWSWSWNCSNGVAQKQKSRKHLRLTSVQVQVMLKPVVPFAPRPFRHPKINLFYWSAESASFNEIAVIVSFDTTAEEIFLASNHYPRVRNYIDRFRSVA